jgi:Bacterial Ig-like domain
MSMREARPLPPRRSVSNRRLIVGTVLLVATGACDDEKSSTELNPQGPPMVRQVFVQERQAIDAEDTRERFGLAFGDHPDIPSRSEDRINGDDRVVEAALAYQDSARLRIVFDELVRGNDIEEILCSDGSYSRVPDGADPDDIERCAGPDLSECEAVCIGPGGPIGIRDENGDGAVDDASGFGFRMIDYGDGELAASVVCDGERMPLIAEGPARSFYNPSGNQLIPADDDPTDATLNLNGIGPALVLFPALGLRTGATCTVAFRPEVVDKDGNRVCAPPGGDIRQDCAEPGNTDAIQFQVEPFAVRVTSPVQDETGVATNKTILLEFVTAVDAETLGAITLSTGGDEVPVEATRGDPPYRVTVVAPDGLLADSEYTLTVATGVTDLFGGAAAEPFTLNFSTGAAPPPPPPDAGVPDAGPADAAP